LEDGDGLLDIAQEILNEINVNKSYAVKIPSFEKDPAGFLVNLFVFGGLGIAAISVVATATVLSKKKKKERQDFFIQNNDSKKGEKK